MTNNVIVPRELLSCPFCGQTPSEYDQSGYSYVKYHTCRFSIKVKSWDGPPYAPELWNRRAAPAAPAAPQPEQSGPYTCIGKGGSYELIGRAQTAGVLKETGRFADEVIVYRDTYSGALYCRAPADFRRRMTLAAQGGDL